MSKNKSLILSALTFVLAIYIFQSCTEDSEVGPSDSEKATVHVYLQDGPGDYDQVNIDVDSVYINVDSTWIPLTPINKGVYNLLDFTNGVDTLLGSTELPAGLISQMRLVLGENNTVMVDSQLYDLKTPSGQTSGIKFNIHQELSGGFTYNLWIDFDAGRSVVETGNGKYILKPVIRAFSEATSGAIKGIVSPDSAQSYVFAVQATDTYSTYADTNGYFFIKGVPANTYDVYFDNSNGWKDTVINSVGVTDGVVTDMDTIFMMK